MKSVLISIRPRWCKLIANGKKTVEVRKSKPKLEAPFKVYIYCTQEKRRYSPWSGKVIGEFVCDRIYQYASDLFRSAPVEGTDISTEEIARLSCLSAKELYEYEHSAEPRENCIYLVGVYGWHISNLVIYDKPKLVSEFYKCGALSMEDLVEELCCYCSQTDYSDKKEIHTPSGVWMCEGTWCGEAYQAYLDDEFAMTRPPQSWCYVEELAHECQ